MPPSVIIVAVALVVFGLFLGPAYDAFRAKFNLEVRERPAPRRKASPALPAVQELLTQLSLAARQQQRRKSEAPLP